MNGSEWRSDEATWWDLIGRFGTAGDERFAAGMISCRRAARSGGQGLRSGHRADQGPACCSWTAGGRELGRAARQAEFRVAGLDNKPYTSKPYPPFTTSTLQQEANRKLGFTARRTMQVAQSLYENGHIPTCAPTRLTWRAWRSRRPATGSTQYGDAYLPGQPRVYVTKVKTRRKLTKRFGRPATRSPCPNSFAAN